MQLRLIVFFCCSFYSYGWLSAQQVDTTITQTFALDSVISVNIDVGDNWAKIQYSDVTEIECSIHIRLSTNNARLLTFVSRSGRYDLEKSIENNKTLFLNSKKSNTAILLKGEEIREGISYTFYVPNGVAVNSTGRTRLQFITPELAHKPNPYPTIKVKEQLLTDEEASRILHITLYPLPDAKALYIQFHELSESVNNAELTITDLQGQQSFHSASEYVESDKILKVAAIDQLPKGNYILQVRLNNGMLIKKPFSKQ